MPDPNDTNPAAELAARLGLDEKPLAAVSLADITTGLLDDRDAALREQNAAEGRVKAINARLKQILEGNNSKRHQHTDGSVVQMITPSAKETVLPEVLLANGVEASIIRKATRISPVGSYVMVTRPKLTDADVAAAVVGEAAAPTTETVQ